MLRREVVKMAFGLGAGTPTRFPYPDRPQPSPGVGPGQPQNLRARTLTIISVPGSGIFGPDFIINAAGSFYYSGTPAAGNLASSIVPGTSPVADPFGNLALPGVTSYFNDVSHSQYIATQVTANKMIFLTAATEAGPWVSSGNSITATVQGLTIQGNAASGTTPLVLSPSGGPVTVQGNLAVTNVLTSTGGSSSTPTVIETDTWNTLTLQNGWASSGGNARFRLMPDNTVWVLGTLNPAGQTSTTFATMVAPYIPSVGADAALVAHTATPPTQGAFTRASITGALIGVNTTTTSGLFGVDMRYPLD